jgi:hypothetical protein
MKIQLRMTEQILSTIHADLSRAHPHATERVGFLSCGIADLADRGILLLVREYHPILDEDYLVDPTVGARIGGGAFRMALSCAYSNSVSMFHVHRHEVLGVPRFSDVDLREYARFIPDFWNVRPTHPHGALLLSEDSVRGLVWIPGRRQPCQLDEIKIVGRHLLSIRSEA